METQPILSQECLSKVILMKNFQNRFLDEKDFGYPIVNYWPNQGFCKLQRALLDREFHIVTDNQESSKGYKW